jgi:NADP-dependent 3-hydroxy acid dehydrogenase YdfG
MALLTGKTALITGGGSGVGLAIARLFLRERAQVVIAGRNADKLQRAAEELKAGSHLLIQVADITDPAQAERLVQNSTATFGRIDILVANAGANIKKRSIAARILARHDRCLSGWRLLLHSCGAASNATTKGRRDHLHQFGFWQAVEPVGWSGVQRGEVRTGGFGYLPRRRGER